MTALPVFHLCGDTARYPFHCATACHYRQQHSRDIISSILSISVIHSRPIVRAAVLRLTSFVQRGHSHFLAQSSLAIKDNIQTEYCFLIDLGRAAGHSFSRILSAE